MPRFRVQAQRVLERQGWVNSQQVPTFEVHAHSFREAETVARDVLRGDDERRLYVTVLLVAEGHSPRFCSQCGTPMPPRKGQQ